MIRVTNLLPHFALLIDALRFDFGDDFSPDFDTPPSPADDVTPASTEGDTDER